jgi:hypothetical protein
MSPDARVVGRRDDANGETLSHGKGRAMNILTDWAESRDRPYRLAEDGRRDEARSLAMANVDAARDAFGAADDRLVEAYDVVIALHEGMQGEVLSAMRARLKVLEAISAPSSRIERAHGELGRLLAASGFLAEAKPHLERRIEQARGADSVTLTSELIRLGLVLKPLGLERVDLRDYATGLLAEGVRLARTNPIERDLRDAGLAAYSALLAKAGATTEVEEIERERKALRE